MSVSRSSGEETSKTINGTVTDKTREAVHEVRGPHDARSDLRKNVKYGTSECIKMSMQTLSCTSEIRRKLQQKLLKAETKQHREKLNGLVSILNELTAQYLGSDGKEYMNSIIPLEYAEELYLRYKTDYVSNRASEHTKQQFVEAILNPNTGLFVSIVRIPSTDKSYVVLRSPDGSTEPVLDCILNEFSNKEESKSRFELNSETVQSILSTMDSEWDRKIACVLLGVNRLVLSWLYTCFYTMEATLTSGLYNYTKKYTPTPKHAARMSYGQLLKVRP